jgi:predicted PurR-regulated permease PerM
MNDLRLTNLLLLIIAIPIVLMGVKLLDFIFVPLIFAMFITLLFIPGLRKLKRNGVPKAIRAGIAILVIVLGMTGLYLLLQLTSQEIFETKAVFAERLNQRLSDLDAFMQSNMGITAVGTFDYQAEMQKDWFLDSLKSVSMFLVGAIPQFLTTLFFVVLLLLESFDFEKMMHSTILRKRFASIKAFNRIEKDIVTFLQVKFLVSLGTGIGTGLFCYAFDVSFPIFWGLFAFIINFVQMIGSFITIILCSLFAFVELELSMTLLYFIMSISGVQVVFGSVLEPVFMGKSFSINIITVLVMLMFWGFIWGIPGMILSIPLTVFIKIILEQYKPTKPIAKLMQ